MQIFFEVVFPVLLVFLLGFAIEKWKKLDLKPLSTVAVYVLTPCLVFQTFYTSALDLQYIYMIVFALILLFSLLFIVKISAYIKKIPPETETGLLLSASFMNVGNYGAPIMLFAFGEEGFAYAISFLVIQSVLMNTFGVYYASRGSGSMRLALKVVFSMPATWALALALLAKLFPFPLPNAITGMTGIVADAAIPIVMLILGMQLARIPLHGFKWGRISYSVVVRLVVSPLIAVGITYLLPLDPLLAKVLILSAAMPTAANIVIFAVQFDANPRLVSTSTLVSTVLSVFTITFLLVLLT